MIAGSFLALPSPLACHCPAPELEMWSLSERNMAALPSRGKRSKARWFMFRKACIAKAPLDRLQQEPLTLLVLEGELACATHPVGSIDLFLEGGDVLPQPDIDERVILRRVLESDTMVKQPCLFRSHRCAQELSNQTGAVRDRQDFAPVAKEVLDRLFTSDDLP